MSNTVEYDILIEVLDAVKDLKKLQQETKKSKKQLDKTKKSGLEMASQIGAAFSGLVAVGGVVVGAMGKIAGAFADAAVGSFELTRAVVDNINDLNDLATVSGISAQGIESLKLAFVSSGQGAEAANTVLQQFPRVLTSIQKGTGDAAKAFNALGLKARDSSGKMKSGDQIFKEVISSLQRIEDTTLKAQVATAIFGRSAAGLIQALGAGEFSEFTDVIERFGTKATPEASQAAADFQKNLAFVLFLLDKTKQKFIENTDGMDIFNTALKHVQAILIGVMAALDSMSPLLSILAKTASITAATLAKAFVVAFALLLAELKKSFLAMSNILNFVNKSVNAVSEAIGGVSINMFKQDANAFTAFLHTTEDVQKGLLDGIVAYKDSMASLEASATAAGGTKSAIASLGDEFAKYFEKLLAGNKTTKDATKAAKEHEKALREAAAKIAAMEKEQARKRKEMFLQAKAQSEAIRRGRQRAAEIEAQANSDLLSELDKINQREKERLRTLRGITAETGKSTEAAQRAARERATRERGAFQQQQDVEAFGNIGQVLSAITSPQGLLDAVGQALGGAVGGAAAGVLGQFAALGDVSGIDADRIEEVMASQGKNRDEALKQILIEDKAAEFEIFFQAIVRGLQILPALLIQTLPPVIAEGALGLVTEIARLPISFLGAIIEGAVFVVRGIGEFFTNLPEDLGKAILDGIGDAFAFFFDPLIKAFEAVGGLFGGSFMSGGRFLSAQGGLRFTGREQGLAMLHSGEMVVPRSGQVSSTVVRDVQAQTSGGGVTININSAVTERSAIDSLVRKIEDRFGSFGQSTSPLFGGQ